MPERRTWIIDFDETLASSSITWALQDAFPKFVAAHQLQFDPKHLKALLLELQEEISHGASPKELAERLFTEMGWSAELQDELLNAVFSNYKPELYDDSIQFLERLRETGDHILIVSNNPRTLEHVPLLGIDDYFYGVFTPFSLPGTLPKPDRSMWDYLCANQPEINPEYTIVVGDDPWSEGAFAEVCGLQCWIVDRMDRFADIAAEKDYGRVRSLLEIPL